MKKWLTLDTEKINDDLFVYLTQAGRKKFIVSVMDEYTTEIISSHSRLEKAEISFDKTIEKLKHLRKN